MTWKGERRVVTWRCAVASARRSLTSTSIGEESVIRVFLGGEADAISLGRGIFNAAIKLTEENGGARGRSGCGGGGAAASFLKFLFVFDLDFDFSWLSSQHFVTVKIDAHSTFSN